VDLKIQKRVYVIRVIIIIIIITIKSYYGAPQPMLRSALQHNLQLKEA